MKLAKILTLTVFIQVLLSFNIVAQQPSLEWTARYFRTAGAQVIGPFYALDKSGNSYVVGTDKINDSINILVIKYNNSGIQQWAKLYKQPGEGYISPVSMTLDTSGNIFVTAQYGQTAFSNLNILTVKFNSSNGNVVWAKKYIGVYGYSTPTEIKNDKQNNIYVVGNADSSLLCVKYDQNGDSIWVKKYHPIGDFAYANSCTIDDSLNIIMTGARSHCVSFPPPGACFDTLLTIKYSTSGIMRWAKTYFYPVNPILSFGIKLTNDLAGNIYVIGRTRNSSNFYLYLTLKYDRNGNQQWVSTYDGPGATDDFIRAIAYEKVANAVYVTGHVSASFQTDCATIRYNAVSADSIWTRFFNGSANSYDGAYDIKSDTTGNIYLSGNSFNNSNSDILTVKYSPIGNVLWSVVYNGPLNMTDAGMSIGIDNSNNIYNCGSSNGDYVVLKYAQPLKITNIGNTQPQTFELMQNYPNPFNPSSKIRFSIPHASFTQIKIYDLLGRVAATLVNEKLKAGTYEVGFDGSGFASGMYFYTLEANGYKETKKMVLIK